MNPSFDAKSPIYLQIMAQIEREIVSGLREPGSKIESVRELAAQMEVNPNTMQRALTELEREGLLYTERTAGRFITQDTARIARVRRQAAQQEIAAFLDAMRNLGYRQKEIIELIEASGEEEAQ